MRKQTKWRLIACTALSIATIPAFAACDALTGLFGSQGEKEENNNLVNVIDGVDMPLVYNEKTGIVSWEAVEDAVKYEVAVNIRHMAAEYMEKQSTTQTQYQLELKAGYNLISVWAYNDAGVEIGVGALNVKLDLDFGAPDPVTNVAYDETTKTFTWDVSENAEKYVVTAMNVLDPNATPIVKETAETSVDLGITVGVYDISVVGVSAKGAEGYAAEYEWFSYVSPDFNTPIEGTDLVNIFDFNDERILETMGLSDYAGWLQNTKNATGSIESEVWYYADADSMESDTKTTDESNGTKSLFFSQPETGSGTFEGVAFLLPEQIPVEKLGIITYDLFRAITPGLNDFYIAVILEDENGVQSIHTVSWTTEGNPDLANSKFKWGKITIDGNSILKKQPEFQGIKKLIITTYNTKGGNAYFDNFVYDTFGTVGDVSYDRETKTVSWDKVIGATSYELTVNGDVVYTGTDTSYVCKTALDANSALNATVQLKAIQETDGAVRTRESEELTLNFFGEVGELTYDRDVLTVTWKDVDGAENYKLVANGETLYEGAESKFVFETAPLKDMAMTLTAIRGTTEKSNDVFVCVCETALAGESCTGFGVATGGEGSYYLADFSNHNYYSNFTYSDCPVSNVYGGIDYTVKTAWNSKVVFTFPKTVSFSKTADETDLEFLDPLTITVRFKAANDGGTTVMYFTGLDGVNYYMNIGGYNSTATVVKDGDWSVSTFSVNLPVNNDLGKNLSESGGIKSFYFSRNKASTTTVAFVTINLDMTNFNKETSAGSKEYILADFNSSQYQAFVKKTGWATSSLDKQEVANGALNLTIDHDWVNGAVTYTLPETVAISSISKITFMVKEPNEMAIDLVDTNGNTGSGNSTSAWVTVSSEADENGYYAFTFDIAKYFSNATNPALTSESLLAKIRIMCRNGGDNKNGVAMDVTIDQITYTKA